MEESACEKRWTIHSEFGQEKTVTADIARLLTERHVHAARIEEVVTAVGEACLNALEHGNRLIRDRLVEIRMCAMEHGCSFRIYDEGEGFAYPPLPDACVARHRPSDARGWGLLFISKFADQIRVGADGGKFYVELAFRLK